MLQVIQNIARKLYTWRSTLATCGVSLLAFGVAVHVIFGANGWVAYSKKKQEYHQLQQEVRQVQKENEQLQSQIKALKTDPKMIEKEAREQLKYAKPGEVVYVLPAPKAPVNGTAAAQKR